MDNIQNVKNGASTYNNCFCLGGKVPTKTGKFVKSPIYIKNGKTPLKLCGGKDGKLKRYHEMTYKEAKNELEAYKTLKGDTISEGAKTMRVSLYLDNAMFGDLHIFVMDFDAWDKESDFFQAANALADKVTRSQGGGYHMFYGISKEKATPLFDQINLLASKTAKSYISRTGAVSQDGKNKVDFFCDAYHFIYEWEEWDNAIGLTDKTEALYELIRDNFSLKRPMDFDEWEDADNGWTTLEGLPEDMMKSQMNDCQKAAFDDLKTKYSSDCSREEWFSRGLDIYHVFGDELGGSVFLWWSKPGHSYNPQGCATTWANICRRGPQTILRNPDWYSNINAFDLGGINGKRDKG